MRNVRVCERAGLVNQPRRALLVVEEATVVDFLRHRPNLPRREIDREERRRDRLATRRSRLAQGLHEQRGAVAAEEA
jgi:hypothetical protein